MIELFIVAFIVVVPGIPAYVIGKRRAVPRPWVAFIPIFGYWIVLLQSTNNSAWFALLAIIPVASIAFLIWMAVAIPSVHGRSKWWTAALVVPGIHLVGLWFSAFTLPKPPAQAVPAPA